MPNRKDSLRAHKNPSKMKKNLKELLQPKQGGMKKNSSFAKIGDMTGGPKSTDPDLS